ncbi:hypothetical protein U91I_02333 [alpha proteobacterium U9-1i]|nr:hypothetical protein U91I_02333 [alpha proteobacterium U9-1i]
MRGQVLAVVGAVMAAALATPASAQTYEQRAYHEQHVQQQQYCSQRRNGNTTAGAVIGGIAGAVLGSQAASRGHRTDGSVLGAVVGATAGAMIGRSNTRCAQAPQGSYDPYAQGQYGQQYPQQYPQQGPGYRGEDDDLYGGPYQESGYRGDNGYRGEYGRQECRTEDVVRYDRRGRRYYDEVVMCRGRDGVWREEDQY